MIPYGQYVSLFECKIIMHISNINKDVTENTKNEEEFLEIMKT